MTALDARDELVPLRTEFDLVWRGCDRGQVQEYVDRVETELRLLATDRDAATARADALARQLEAARAEVARLTGELNRPIDPATLSDRARRMAELAREEAAEIVARANAAADQIRAEAEQSAERVRRRGEYLVAEAERRRQELEAEHRELMATAHARIEEAERRRRELDDRAAELRAQETADFELAMRERRAEAMRELADQRAAAEAEAARLVGEATGHAERIVAQARAEVARLAAQRDRVAASLRAVEQVVAAAGPLLAPLPGEHADPVVGTAAEQDERQPAATSAGEPAGPATGQRAA